MHVFSYASRITNEQLFHGGFPEGSGFHDLEREIVRRRIIFARECAQALDQDISMILLAVPEKGGGNFTTYPKMLCNCTGLDIVTLDSHLRNNDEKMLAWLLEKADAIIDATRDAELNKVRTFIQDIGTGPGAKRKAEEMLKPGSLASRRRYDDKRISQLVCVKCQHRSCDCCQNPTCIRPRTRHVNHMRCMCCNRGTDQLCMAPDAYFEEINGTMKFMCKDCYKLKKT